MISYSFEFSLGQEASKSNSKYPGTIYEQFVLENHANISMNHMWIYTSSISGIIQSSY